MDILGSFWEASLYHLLAEMWMVRCWNRQLEEGKKTTILS